MLILNGLLFEVLSLSNIKLPNRVDIKSSRGKECGVD